MASMNIFVGLSLLLIALLQSISADHCDCNADPFASCCKVKHFGKNLRPPFGCNGTLYCPAGDDLEYPGELITEYVEKNLELFQHLYDDVVLYKAIPSDGSFPKNIRGVDLCDYAVDYPLIMWGFTFPYGWLPLIQTPSHKQYFRLEFCESMHCSQTCFGATSQCQARTTCKTSHGRYRALAWSGEKIVSVRMLLPDCCKCAYDEPTAEELVKAQPKSISSSYCENCPLSDYECLQTCVNRLPPSTSFRYCNECRQYDWHCLSSCYASPIDNRRCSECQQQDFVCLRVCATGNDVDGESCDKCAKNDWKCWAECHQRKKADRICHKCPAWDLACLRACVPGKPRLAPYCRQCDLRDQFCGKVCRKAPDCQYCHSEPDILSCLRICKEPEPEFEPKSLPSLPNLAMKSNKACECDRKLWEAWCEQKWFTCLTDEQRLDVLNKAKSYQ